MNLLLLKHSPHGIVAPNHASIAGILQIVSPHVSPDPLDRLRPGELKGISAYDGDVE